MVTYRYITSEINYKDTRLDKGRIHKGPDQLNNTNIQDNCEEWLLIAEDNST